MTGSIDLDILAVKGVPYPLRLQAAALGISVDDIICGLECNVVDRQTVKDFKEMTIKTPKYNRVK